MHFRSLAGIVDDVQLICSFYDPTSRRYFVAAAGQVQLAVWDMSTMLCVRNTQFIGKLRVLSALPSDGSWYYGNLLELFYI